MVTELPPLEQLHEELRVKVAIQRKVYVTGNKKPAQRRAMSDASYCGHVLFFVSFK